MQQRWAVQVRSKAGSAPIVYASGQFDQGHTNSDFSFWDVNLVQIQTCPLSDLENVSIHVGGVLKAMFGPHSTFEGVFDAHDDMTRTIQSPSTFVLPEVGAFGLE